MHSSRTGRDQPAAPDCYSRPPPAEGRCLSVEIALAVGGVAIAAACVRPRRWRSTAVDVMAFAAAGAVLDRGGLDAVKPVDPGLLGLLLAVVAMLAVPAVLLARAGGRRWIRIAAMIAAAWLLTMVADPSTVGPLLVLAAGVAWLSWLGGRPLSAARVRSSSAVLTLAAIAALLVLGAVAAGSWIGLAAASLACGAGWLLPPPGHRPAGPLELLLPVPVRVAALLAGAVPPVVVLASGHAPLGAAVSGSVLGAAVWLARGQLVPDLAEEGSFGGRDPTVPRR